MGRRPIPNPSFFETCDYLGFVHGARRWRNRDGKRLYTWDGLHGEIEVFDSRGRHLGVLDAISGDLTKEAVRGRRIDV